MDFEPLKYSREEIDNAGLLIRRNLLRDFFAFQSNKLVVDNWRAAHNYPLERVYNELRSRARKINKNSLVVFRLKRYRAIEMKLKRFPDITLTQMQDIGGCRAVVNSIEEVNTLAASIKKGIENNEFQWERNYILAPKKDGYRSYHLVYSINSKEPEYKQLHGIRTEIQIRTRLQHYWATAVETVDFLKKFSLKTGSGSQSWRTFFTLMSTFLAIREKQPIVADTPKEMNSLKEQLRKISLEIDVEQWLDLAPAMLEDLTDEEIEEAGYYVITIFRDRTGILISFQRDEMDNAISTYAQNESAYAESGDTVLVLAESLQELKEAYPNYSLDTYSFYSLVKEAIE